MTNVEWAEQSLKVLALSGVREVILCAGARNSPLVSVLSKAEGVTLHSFFDERSAGFFALGRMQRTRKPVVVCTTSGTAVAELLPAVVEADYQRLPLVVLSADRPKHYRHSGAPQTIIQPGIFSHYVEKTIDLERGESLEVRFSDRPLHLNFCFGEPLVDGPIEKWSWPQPGPIALESEVRLEGLPSVQMKKPLVIVSRMSAQDAESVKATLLKWRRPLYIEAHSQLRGNSDLKDLEVTGGERALAHLNFDGVIRVGEVPTLRYWRDLEYSQLPVLAFGRTPYSGLPRIDAVHSLSAMAQIKTHFEPWNPNEREMAFKFNSRLSELLSEFPLSESTWVRRLSEKIPNQAQVFLGNSLPIREWDLAATREQIFKIFGNRGTNGIDGLISTFLGMADLKSSNWAVIGDLSALYDLSAPWAAREMSCDLNLVIINNGGGKIFSRLFHNALFENQHALNFKAWAEMWKWDYSKIETIEQFERLSPYAQKPRVIEIVPHSQHTLAFENAWEKYEC